MGGLRKLYWELKFGSLLNSPELLLNFVRITPLSDQDRISPYNINTISSRQVVRIKKNTN